MSLLYMIPAAFFVPVIHEWVKALCSARQGDPTPKNKGFLSGSLLKYFEPVGFFLIMMFGYGWGQPVPTSPLYYRDRRRGVILTYVIPSVVNLLLGAALIAAVTLILKLVPQLSSVYINAANFSAYSAEMLRMFSGDIGTQILIHIINELLYFAQVNIGIAFFNLIPVYPMDCARVLQVFLPPQTVAAMNRYEKVFQVILLIVMFFGWLQRYLLDPLTNAVFNLVALLA